MKYVEIAKGTPYNRGILIPVDRLSNHLGEEPVYRSVYLYDDTAFEYVKENGSLKNFFGVRYIDKVPVDICLLYTSPSPRDLSTSRMPSSA